MVSKFENFQPAFKLAEYLAKKEIPCKLYKESGNWHVSVKF